MATLRMSGNLAKILVIHLPNTNIEVRNLTNILGK
jgi:hypothetical protein